MVWHRVICCLSLADPVFTHQLFGRQVGFVIPVELCFIFSESGMVKLQLVCAIDKMPWTRVCDFEQDLMWTLQCFVDREIGQLSLVETLVGNLTGNARCCASL